MVQLMKNIVVKTVVFLTLITTLYIMKIRLFMSFKKPHLYRDGSSIMQKLYHKIIDRIEDVDF